MDVLAVEHYDSSIFIDKYILDKGHLLSFSKLGCHLAKLIILWNLVVESDKTNLILFVGAVSNRGVLTFNKSEAYNGPQTGSSKWTFDFHLLKSYFSYQFILPSPYMG